MVKEKELLVRMMTRRFFRGPVQIDTFVFFLTADCAAWKNPNNAKKNHVKNKQETQEGERGRLVFGTFLRSLLEPELPRFRADAGLDLLSNVLKKLANCFELTSFSSRCNTPKKHTYKAQFASKKNETKPKNKPDLSSLCPRTTGRRHGFGVLSGLNALLLQVLQAYQRDKRVSTPPYKCM